MATLAPAFLTKLQNLPSQRQAEVEDFVEFLTQREARATAAARLGDSLAKLDATGMSPLSDEEIAAEIADARRERAARRH